MRILVAIDGSKTALRGLRTAIKLLKQLRPGEHALDLICVRDPRSVQLASRALGSDAVKQVLDEMTAEDLADAQTMAKKSGLKTRSLSKTGPIVTTLAKTATAGKYDMLVLGAKGRSNFGDLIAGSVAQRISAHTKVPALLVR